MTDSQIISWIFCAIAMASEKGPSSIKEVSMIADGINHAVPTQRELKFAIDWLLKNDLIKIESKKYTLTKSGHINYNFARLHTNTILNIWKNLERQLKNVG
jgi:hypothetical protein